MLERFTDDARASVVATQELCPRLGCEEVEPVHLLLALCQPQGSVRDLLAEHGLTDATVTAALRREGQAPARRVGRSRDGAMWHMPGIRG